MTRPENYLESTINDIVFEGRNKTYGAYYLRTHENAYMLRALGIGLALVGLMALWMLRERAAATDEPVITIISKVTEVTVPKLPELPKVQTTQPEPPAAQQSQAQPEVQYTEMRVVSNTTPVTASPTTIQDLKDRIISTRTNDLPPGIKGSMLPAGNTGGNPNTGSTGTIHEFSEVTPEFIGGFAAMQIYIAEHVDYPSIARSQGVEGIVYVSMVINADGSVSDVKVIRGIGFGCDEAAAEVVASMPKWKPGMQNKQNVRVRTTIPINFMLED